MLANCSKSAEIEGSMTGNQTSFPFAQRLGVIRDSIENGILHERNLWSAEAVESRRLAWWVVILERDEVRLVISSIVTGHPGVMPEIRAAGNCRIGRKTNRLSE